MKSRFNDLYQALNDEQRKALNHRRSTVVAAGPGSGKTRMICLKAAKLYSEGVGVACISFGNAAVEKIKDELFSLGVRDWGQLYVGTTHNFCLQNIIYPFSNSFPDDLPINFGIASDMQSLRILYQVLNNNPNRHNVRLNSNSSTEIKSNVEKYYKNKLIPLRHSIISGQRKKRTVILEAYDRMMFAKGLLDFEMVVEIALNFLQKSEEIQRYIISRFPWFVIDEYQDLGANLHALTEFLVENLHVQVLAVGDPDQSIYQLNEGQKSYLDVLADKQDFEPPIQTTQCYRFGDHLIAASLSILKKPAIYSSDNEHGEGEVHFVQFDTLKEQADWIISTLVPKLCQLTNDKSKIAILYRQRGVVPDELRRAIHDHEINFEQIQYTDERNNELPHSPIINWLRQCADWSLAFHSQDTNSLNCFPQLLDFYLSLLKSARKKPSTDDEFEVELLLRNILVAYSDLDARASDWLKGVCEALNIRILLETAGRRSGELEDLNYLLENQVVGRFIRELSLRADNEKIVLTTMHSSKGREFDYVILPGTQKAIMPWSGSKNENSSRRLFYVACTRARTAIYIVYSDPTEEILMPWGKMEICRASPFIAEIKEGLANFSDQN